MHPEEPELRELRHQLAREDALLEPLADLGQHALAYEPAHGVADRLLLVLEERVEGQEIQGVEGRELRRRRRHQHILFSLISQSRP
jgi:hypothetical protein